MNKSQCIQDICGQNSKYSPDANYKERSDNPIITSDDEKSNNTNMIELEFIYSNSTFNYFPLSFLILQNSSTNHKEV